MLTVTLQDIIYRAAELAGRTRDKIPPSEAIMLQGYITIDLQAVWNKAAWPDLIPDPVAVTVSSNRQFSKNEWSGPGPSGMVPCNLSFNGDLTFFTVSVQSKAAPGSVAAPHGLLPGAQIVINNTDPTNSLINPLFIGTWTVGTIVNLTTFQCIIPSGSFGGAAFGNNWVTYDRTQEMGDLLGVYDKDPSQTTKARWIDFEEANGYVRIYEPQATVFVEYLLPRPDLNLLSAVSGFVTTSYPIPARFSSYLAANAAGTLMNADMPGTGTGNLALAERSLVAEMDRIVLSSRRAAVSPRRGVVNRSAQC